MPTIKAIADIRHIASLISSQFNLDRNRFAYFLKLILACTLAGEIELARTVPFAETLEEPGYHHNLQTGWNHLPILLEHGQSG